MAWDFQQIVEFGRQFAGPAGAELAFVFSEWTTADGLALTAAYPAVRTVSPPQNALPNPSRYYVDVGAGWEPVTSLPGFVAAGVGEVGILQSGVGNSMVIAGWAAKGIAAGYIIATGATLDLINSQRTTGLALIRTYINADETAHPLAPDTPFTVGQVTALGDWVNEHGIPNTEFAALFDVSAAQLSNWLTTHPRWQFAQQIHERFT
jgi:hypothetical protein